MSQAGLYGAAGASVGLEELLARRLQEQQFGETQRHTRNQEGFQEKQLQEQTATRRAQMASTEADKNEGRQLQKMSMDQLRHNQEILDQNADANRANQLEIAKIRAQQAGAGGGAIRTMNVKGPDGRDMTMLVNSRGEVVYAAPSQLPAGMKGQEASTQSLVDQIDQIGQMGEANGWGGVGMVTAPFQGTMKKITGRGNDQNDQLRIALDSVKADVAHEKYGSAFTATERAMLSNFAPGSNMSAPAIKNRLLIMRRVIANRNAELAAGQHPSPLQLMDPSASHGGTAQGPAGTGNSPGAATPPGGAGAPPGAAPQAPPGWKYVPKPGGGWTAVEAR